MNKTKAKSKTSYNSQPCERCGSEKLTSKTWNETIETSLGEKLIIEVSQTVCTNKECQAAFNVNREKEMKIVNDRKVAKEEQDVIRKKNIAKTIADRQK